MKLTLTTYMRLLGIDPNSRGISYAVLDGSDKLVDWGTKHLPNRKKPDKEIKTSCKFYNRDYLQLIENLIDFYTPHTIVCENTAAKDSRRGTKVRNLLKPIGLLATKRNLAFCKFSRVHMMETFAQYGVETKHDMASLLGRMFRDLESKIPRKRKAWMSESVWMNVFVALALCLTYYEKEPPSH